MNCSLSPNVQESLQHPTEWVSKLRCVSCNQVVCDLIFLWGQGRPIQTLLAQLDSKMASLPVRERRNGRPL